jgi:hypothetical protein
MSEAISLFRLPESRKLTMIFANHAFNAYHSVGAMSRTASVLGAESGWFASSSTVELDRFQFKSSEPVRDKDEYTTNLFRNLDRTGRSVAIVDNIH